ncbi:glycine oxidase ThiO [Thiomicrorhabdus sp. ZW0627]|uniref:glycine oxidase ThiO n=1 Tax=Thiomicrorhabdus sp. ZW0627 TaxID=3039774 RepID=UPI0024369345|nr:glycine oxidase ThiO [Thiomicrorhabdus sp. ZW0627]MDG6774744.1 glycine oxidase ThiO [Thiomicrorhabdus sp. ZW0627]
MPNTPNIAIVGAGLIGRVVAVSLSESHKVTLFDRDDRQGSLSAAHLAAAMLAPLAESADSSLSVMQMGQRSLELWPGVLEKLQKPVFFQQNGSLILAYEQDYGNLVDFGHRIKGEMGKDYSSLTPLQLEELEPELAQQPHTFQHILWLPEEGQLDNRELLESLASTLEQRNVVWHQNTEVSIENRQVVYDGERRSFDWVIDCRGLGAKDQILQTGTEHGKHKLRGVRGEVVRLYAPEVNLNRPVRLMHPRYPIYIAPKADHRFVVGATQIETEDQRQPTVRSALELLSACFSVHKGFAEAEILEIKSGLRPAFEDNEPKIRVDGNLIQVNGLFRHGYLLAPAVAEQCIALIDTALPKPPVFEHLIEFTENSHD